MGGKPHTRHGTCSLGKGSTWVSALEILLSRLEVTSLILWNYKGEKDAFHKRCGSREDQGKNWNKGREVLPNLQVFRIPFWVFGYDIHLENCIYTISDLSQKCQ